MHKQTKCSCRFCSSKLTNNVLEEYLQYIGPWIIVMCIRLALVKVRRVGIRDTRIAIDLCLLFVNCQSEKSRNERHTNGMESDGLRRVKARDK